MTMIKTLLQQEGLWLGYPSEKGGSNNDYAITCLSGTHEDSTPSLNIDKHTGMGGCLVCGFAIGNIYEYLDKTAPELLTLEDELLDMIQELEDGLDTIEIPIDAEYVKKPYRGIGVDVLNLYSAYKHNGRIWFVIRNSFGDIQYMIGRILEDSTETAKYWVVPKGAKKILFPFSAIPYNGEMILVEGITDLLWLNQLGYYNVISGNGTTIAGPDTLAMYANKGMKQLKILYDGDIAGRAAAKKLKDKLSKETYLSVIIDLPDDYDPKMMKSEDVKEVLG